MDKIKDIQKYITINGTKLFTRIIMTNRDNPLILFLHGGPGAPDSFIYAEEHRELAHSCTMVFFHQRGTGKSYSTKSVQENEITMPLYIEDTHKMIEYLKRRFNKKQIYLFGHSFGSLLGVLVAKQYPKDIQAYIGMSQCVSAEQEVVGYQFALEQATKHGDKRSMNALTKMGKPVHGNYKGRLDAFVQRDVVSKYITLASGKKESIVGQVVTLAKPFLWEFSGVQPVTKYLSGLVHVKRQLADHYEVYDVARDVPKLQMPCYLLVGRYDYVVPYKVAVEWFEKMKAPYKKLFVFEKAGHSPAIEEPKVWQKVMLRILNEQENT